MKGNFLSAVGAASSIVGAVIGAGFVTGAEIVRFFSGTFLLPACALLFIVLTVFFFSMLYLGGLYGGLNRLNLRVSGGFSRLLNGLISVCSFVTLSGMCAGIDALFSSFSGVDERIPVLSAVFLVISAFICKRGIGGVQKFNSVLVPLMVGFIAAACAGGDVTLRFTGRQKIFSVIIYASMNCFLSAPVIVDSGRGKSLAVDLAAAIAAAFTISACAYLIMNKISRGSGTDEDLPLLSSFGGSRVFSAAFALVTAAGILTTLVSSHYALLKVTAKSPVKHALNAIIAVLTLAFSRLGFYEIVSYAYPVIGVIGLLYVGFLTVYSSRSLFFADGYLFDKRNERVHSRREKAQRKRCGVNEVQFENLPAVNDKVAQPRA